MEGAAEGSSPFVGPGSEALRGQSCNLLGQCSSDTPKITAEELPDKLAAVPAWKLNQDKTAITRSFVAKSFTAALKFFQAVGEVAEAEGHHPDLHLTDYRNVRIDLSTHAAGGLTLFDFIVASKIDALPAEYSPKWLREQQAAQQ